MRSSEIGGRATSSIVDEPTPCPLQPLDDVLRKRRSRLLDGGEEVLGRRALGGPPEVLALESVLRRLARSKLDVRRSEELGRVDED